MSLFVRNKNSNYITILKKKKREKDTGGIFFSYVVACLLISHWSRISRKQSRANPIPNFKRERGLFETLVSVLLLLQPCWQGSIMSWRVGFGEGFFLSKILKSFLNFSLLLCSLLFSIKNNRSLKVGASEEK